jgi:hypothetical protein
MYCIKIIKQTIAVTTHVALLLAIMHPIQAQEPDIVDELKKMLRGRVEGKTEGPYPDGDIILYSSNNKKVLVDTWKYGQPIRRVIFHPNGRVYSEVDQVEGKPHGLRKSYYPDGKIATTMVFVRGIGHGYFVSFFTNGQVHVKTSFEMGKIQGNCATFLPDGSLGLVEDNKDGNVITAKEHSIPSDEQWAVMHKASAFAKISVKEIWSAEVNKSDDQSAEQDMPTQKDIRLEVNKDPEPIKPKKDFKITREKIWNGLELAGTWKGRVNELPLEFVWHNPSYGELSFVQNGTKTILATEVEFGKDILIFHCRTVISGDVGGVGAAQYNGRFVKRGVGARIEGLWYRTDKSDRRKSDTFHFTTFE